MFGNVGRGAVWSSEGLLAWGGWVPANYGRLPNANGGQAFTCLGRHQPACEAHQEDIRGGLCQVPPPALTGHTFRAEMSSLSGDNNTYQTLPTMFVNLPGWSGTLSIS